MELRGSIKSWNDDKGFGFVSPEGGGPAVFAHISAMRGDRRPQAGDAVFYIASKDNNGRLRAEHMRLQGLSLDQPAIRIKPKAAATRAVKTAKPTRKRQPSNAAVPQNLGVKALVFSVLCAAPLWGTLQLFAHYHWVWVLALYPAVSLLAVVLYGNDKRRAMAGEWRTQETTLHLVELLGGWPGALLAQQLYRHKTRKLGYQVPFWIIVLLHQALWLDWLLYDGEHVVELLHILIL